MSCGRFNFEEYGFYTLLNFKNLQINKYIISKYNCKEKETLISVEYFSDALQILSEILSQVQSKLFEKCRKSKGYETISGRTLLY